MAFWSDNFAGETDLKDPKRKFRFRVEFGGIAGGPANSTEYSTMSKSSAAQALGTVIVTQMDAEGKDLEQWTLWNAFITEVKYGDLEYGSDDLTELSVTLKYDWARIKTAGDSVASAATGKDFFNV